MSRVAGSPPTWSSGISSLHKADHSGLGQAQKRQQFALATILLLYLYSASEQLKHRETYNMQQTEPLFAITRIAWRRTTLSFSIHPCILQTYMLLQPSAKPLHLIHDSMPLCSSLQRKIRRLCTPGLNIANQKPLFPYPSSLILIVSYIFPAWYWSFFQS